MATHDLSNSVERDTLATVAWTVGLAARVTRMPNRIHMDTGLDNLTLWV